MANQGGGMKVINLVVASLIVVLIAQSFITACPTCLDQLNHGVNHDLIGEMESTEEDRPYIQQSSKPEPMPADLNTHDLGYTDYDQALLAGLLAESGHTVTDFQNNLEDVTYE